MDFPHFTFTRLFFFVKLLFFPKVVNIKSKWKALVAHAICKCRVKELPFWLE